MDIIFIVGKILHDSVWMTHGTFEKEDDAIEFCKKDKEYFIAEVESNKPLPKDAMDAISLWWPNYETKLEGKELQKHFKELEKCKTKKI